MRKALFIFVVLAIGLPLHAGELLDRVVVTVNGNALLLSDWDDEVRYEAFMSGRPINGVSTQERENALSRIIDQELLREQARGAEFKANSDEIDEQVKNLKSQFAPDHAGRDWSASLEEYGLDEDRIRKHIELEMNQLRLIDERLRPSVEIGAPAIEAYYKEKIAPQNTAAQQVSFDEAKDKIRKVLTEQKMNQLLDAWLESLRAQAQIRRLGAVPSEPLQR